MIIHVTMKDGVHQSYDGVISIIVNREKLFINYYTPSSFISVAELNMNKIKSFHYGKIEE